MKLVINEDEVKAVLLDWANSQFPTAHPAVFNTVEIDAAYSSVRKVEFSHEEPPKQDAE